MPEEHDETQPESAGLGDGSKSYSELDSPHATEAEVSPEEAKAALDKINAFMDANREDKLLLEALDEARRHIERKSQI